MDKSTGLRASVLALALAWMPTAGAMSFDCAKASGAVERLLCTDQRLDAADEWLARRYAALAALSPARAATARWLIEHKAMPAQQAEQVAAAIVATWVDARIAFGRALLASVAHPLRGGDAARGG
ncbi:hypothetical protein [Xanthomonas bundabergensis]|uniref:hypothetical protein n=1 Tax=Xanthomonas bundabergensis TaxID=3160842 RepID=UPI003513C3B7